MSSMIPGHASTSRPPPEDAESNASRASQGAAQLKSSPMVSSKIQGGASASRAPEGPASANSSPTRSSTATKSTSSSRARQVTVRLEPSPPTKLSTDAGGTRTSRPPQRLARPNSSLSSTKSSVVPGNTTISRPPQRLAKPTSCLSLAQSSVVPGNTTISRPPQGTARFKSLSTKPSMIPSNANVSRPQTGTRFNSMSAKTDSAVIHHHPNEFLDSRIQAGLLASGNESRVLILSGGQGGRGGDGGVQGQGGAGGTGDGPRVHITAHNVTNIHPSPAVVQASQVLNHCPPPSKNFQGRQVILNEMHLFFAENTGMEHIYVLYGLGGAGKTQIALKVIADSTRFTDRLLVDASSTERIETGLKNIAIAKASGESWQDGLRWLFGKHEPWLLFFDNADDPQVDLNSFIPRCNHGNILITSRNQGLKGYGAHTLVSNMEEPDAITLLLKSAHHMISPTNNQLAAELVQELCYLPLAIVQAGAFILQSEDLSGYLALFKKNRVNLLSEKPTQSYDGYSLSVFTTWQISFNKLSQPAAMFLQLCSFLHWDEILEEIFSGASRYSFPSWGPPKENLQQALEFLSHFVGPSREWNTFDFVKVTNEIKAYSLINFNAEKKSFSIHPLVHEWSQTTLADLNSAHSCMIDILGMCIVEIPRRDRLYLRESAGQYTKALKLELNTLEKTREILGDDHPDTLTAMNNLADTYHCLGRFEDAEQLQVVVLEKRRKILSEEHPDTLRAINNLGSTYHCLGRFDKAEKLKLVVLEKQRKLLGLEHLDTLTTMKNLAKTYHILGRFADAEQLQLVVLEKRKKILSDENPHTLNAMNNLANTYCSLGQFEEAEQLEDVVLEKRRKILSDEHPHTLIAMTNLARTYFSLGRFEDAEQLQLVALEKQRKFLSDEHPDRLTVMNNLADTYHSLGRFEDAEQLQVVVLEKERKILILADLKQLKSCNLCFWRSKREGVFGDDPADVLLVIYDQFCGPSSIQPPPILLRVLFNTSYFKLEPALFSCSALDRDADGPDRPCRQKWSCVARLADEVLRERTEASARTVAPRIQRIDVHLGVPAAACARTVGVGPHGERPPIPITTASRSVRLYVAMRVRTQGPAYRILLFAFILARFPPEEPAPAPAFAPKSTPTPLSLPLLSDERTIPFIRPLHKRSVGLGLGLGLGLALPRPWSALVGYPYRDANGDCVCLRFGGAKEEGDAVLEAGA
ncbi:hypothetical protein K438DRAFT_1938399 [Mycena galopus ATCC 62051]|nr:hypothetical protein K438DRAFT_1938399 [Mycena galopus ATCC 62051]